MCPTGISGTIDGLSDVNRYGNFCDPEQLEGYGECCFDPDQASLHTAELESVHGIRAGGSSGAAVSSASTVSHLAQRRS